MFKCHFLCSQRLSLTLIVVFLTLHLQQAEASDLSKPLEVISLDTALKQVMLQHPEIQASRNLLSAAQEDLDAAEWGRFPTFGVDSELGRRGDSQITARIEQPLWTGGRVTAQINLSQAQQVDAAAEVQATSLVLLNETATVYFDVLRVESQLQTSRDNENEHARLVDTISRRTEAEINPDADLILAESRFNQAKIDRLRFTRELIVARSRLEQLLDRSIGSLQQPEPITLHSRYVTNLQKKALAWSPRLNVLKAQVDQSHAEIKLAEAQSMPTVVAGFERVVGELQFDGQDRERAYIAIQFKPGAGLSSFSVVKAANARKAATADRLRTESRAIRLEVQTLWAEIEALQFQLPSMYDTTEGSSFIVDSYLRQFQVGKKSWLDVLNVQREKAQAYYNLANVKIPLQLAKIKLLFLTGEHHIQQAYGRVRRGL